MYLALYDENIKHIANVTNVTFDLTQRAYDDDNFSADGVCEENVNEAAIAILCDEDGTQRYACFVDSVTSDANKRTIKGQDFKALWDTEVMIDYTQPNSFDPRLSVIFNTIASLVFDGPDVAFKKIKVQVNIPTDNTDTEDVYGSYQDTYEFANAKTYLTNYLKYYSYNIESKFDVTNKEIIFDFIKNNEEIKIRLKDFIYELTTTSNSVNKTIATIKWNSETDEDGNQLEPRPSTLATKYYYLNKNNDIVQADETGDIEGRIYPVKCQMYEDEYLADAQFDAVYALANARYVDNIIITSNSSVDPIDLTSYDLNTMVNLYFEGKLYKTLPISEKEMKLDSNGLNTSIKLGFKKILLTEIIKGD